MKQQHEETNFAGTDHEDLIVDRRQAEVPEQPLNRANDSGAIAELAFRFWTDRGCPDGSPEQDWFRAEEEIRSRRSLE